jgi:hypothetical protein
MRFTKYCKIKTFGATVGCPERVKVPQNRLVEKIKKNILKNSKKLLTNRFEYGIISHVAVLEPFGHRFI